MFSDLNIQAQFGFVMSERLESVNDLKRPVILKFMVWIGGG